jgi:hypothetical protein
MLERRVELEGVAAWWHGPLRSVELAVFRPFGSTTDAPVAFVVHGLMGQGGGNLPALAASEAFLQSVGIPEPASERTLVEKLTRAFAAVESELSRLSDERTGPLAATFLAAYFSRGHVAFAQAGDSRAWLLRDGVMKQVIEAHTLWREAELSETPIDKSELPNAATCALGLPSEGLADLWCRPAGARDRPAGRSLARGCRRFRLLHPYAPARARLR